MSSERLPGVDMDATFAEDPANFFRALDLLEAEPEGPADVAVPADQIDCPIAGHDHTLAECWRP